MNEVTLPPAPNWYLSSILACANDGTVAWGAKNAIVVLKNVKKVPNYTIIPNAHSEKVNTLAFSPEYGQPGKNLLVSGGDEHIIRIWDMDTMTAVSSQSYLDKKQTVIGVDWSKCEPTLVCSISADGYLISWNTQYSVCQTITLGKMTATCIACCPHKSNIAAVGTKNGLIYVINLQGSGNIIYKMRGHDTDITSLSWCPIDINIFNESNPKDLLLASGAKDRTIFIWKAGGDGRYEMQLPLPKNPQDSHRHRTQLGASVGNFTVVRWLEPKYLLVNSVYGELLSIQLSMSMKATEWKLLHGHHGRGIFSIGNVPLHPSELDENWRLTNALTVWTTAQDRQVICSTIENNSCSIEYSVPTHAGFIYCIASCPLDTSRIAYGGGDALLRLWNLSEPHGNTFDIASLWQKIMGRVTAIAWHPEQENVLAMGTSEGRIGIFDTNNISKPPVIYQQYHRRTVYSLGWGINPSTKQYAIYSCGDNELVYYEHGKPHNAPTVFIKKNCTEFCWKPDLSCMVIGYDDGCLLFCNDKLEMWGMRILHLKKAVNCLVWHPESTVTDIEYSPLRHYFAAATNGNAITIFDMTNMINQMNNDNDVNKIALNGKDNAVQYKVVCTLVGHVDRVVCLAWSPHASGHLVSGSFDNTAQVWNVITQELIGTYVGHCGPIYSCMWSPLDPDLIITGSADFSLRIWRLSEQKVVIPQQKLEIKKNKSKKNKKKGNNIETITRSIENVSISNNNIANDSVHMGNNTINGKVNTESKVSHNKEPKNRIKKGNFFSVYRNTMSRKEIVLASCLKLAKKILNQHNDELTSSDDDDDDDDEIPTIFGTKEDITKIINIEKLMHLAQDQHLMAAEMSIWSNNLRQQLEDAAKELRLNDFLVSLAPSLSVKMWQTMCEAYATQLVQELNPDKAVCYLLCIHKIREAIEIFLQFSMYREAYILAKCKLDTDDSMLRDILEVWAKSLGRTGQFEEAAQCCIQLGDITRAAKFLARRKDILTLETAAQLASLAKNNELIESILDDAMTELLLHYNYEKCRELIKTFPILQYRLIHIEAAEELKKQRELLDESYILCWLEEKSKCGLLDILKQHHEKSESSEYRKLIAVKKSDVPEKVAMLWMMISHEIALATISPTDKIKIDHIVTAFGILSRYEIMYPVKSDEHHINFLIGLLSILNARCFAVSGYHGDHNIPVFKSLRGYICLSLLNWFVDKLIKDPNNKIPVTLVIEVIKKTLADGLDPIAVKYWTLNSEISKLQTSIASCMGNSLKNSDDNDDNDDKECEKDPVILMARLESLRNDKEKFITERVCAPSPIVIYSKAIELCNLLTNEVIKNDFTKHVTDTWNLAVS